MEISFDSINQKSGFGMFNFLLVTKPINADTLNEQSNDSNNLMFMWSEGNSLI